MDLFAWYFSWIFLFLVFGEGGGDILVSFFLFCLGLLFFFFLTFWLLIPIYVSKVISFEFLGYKTFFNIYNDIESSFDTSKTETVLNSNNNNTLLNKK